MKNKRGIRKSKSSKSQLKSAKLEKVSTLGNLGIKLNHNETILRSA